MRVICSLEVPEYQLTHRADNEERYGFYSVGYAVHDPLAVLPILLCQHRQDGNLWFRVDEQFL